MQSPKCRENFVTVADGDAIGLGVQQVNDNIPSASCRGWKNNALDACGDPNGSQFLRRRISGTAKTAPNHV